MGRYDKYGFARLDVQAAAKVVEERLGVQLQARTSNYGGLYFVRRKGTDRELMVFQNRDEERDAQYPVLLDVNDTDDMDTIRKKLTDGYDEPAFLRTTIVFGQFTDEPDEDEDEMPAPRLDEVERAVLAIVAKGGGNLGWHEIEVRLGMIDLPRRDYNVLTILRRLEARGLVASTARGNGQVWRALPASGRSAVDYDALVAALRAGPAELLAKFPTLIEDPARFAKTLHRLGGIREDAADAVAFGALQLPEPYRTGLARSLWASSNHAHSRALYSLLAPARLDVPGRAWKAFADDWDWDTCINAALIDEEDAVLRQAGAAMVFGTNRGDRFAPRLLQNLTQAGPGERWAILLALGSAHDGESLAALRAAARDGDAAIASAAIRALAQRRDGRADALAALLGPPGPLRSAALFALAHVTEALATDELERLDAAAAGAPDLREALAQYRLRNPVSS